MSNFKALSLGIVLAFMAGAANAHSSHAPMEPITQEAAADRAAQVIQNLLARNQLESSWANAQATETLEQDTSRGKVWVVRYVNPNASDAAKQDLYIFIDELGNVLTANHEGTL